MKGRRTIAWTIMAIVLLAAAGVVVAARRPSTAATNPGVPTVRVKRGDLDLKIYATGELHATRSMMLTAPPIGGGNLKITRLLHTGTPVKKGDVIIEFDPSEQHYKLEQNRSELLQAEQEIIKARADAAVQTAKDKVDLLKAHFDVRRAELDVQKNELLSTIDAKKNDLALEQAKRALAQLEEDIKSHAVSGEAGISLAQEKHNKAKLAMDEALQNIEKMQVTSPMDGLVSLEKNSGSVEFFFTGMSLPEFREGDQAEPGSAICQVIDATEMELTTKVGEVERSNVKVGQSADVELDALPGKILKGTVKTAGGMSTRQFFDESSGGQFEVSIQLAEADSRLRPGLTAHIVIVGDQQRNVLYVPRQALFLKDGQRVLYVSNGNGFEAREVKVQNQNESRASVTGMNEGTVVALADPTAPRKASSSGSAGLGGGAP
jgi:HlyD family secretion protein